MFDHEESEQDIEFEPDEEVELVDEEAVKELVAFFMSAGLLSTTT